MTDDTDRTPLQGHKSQFFMDAHRAQDPGRVRKASEHISESVKVYLTLIESACRLMFEASLIFMKTHKAGTLY